MKKSIITITLTTVLLFAFSGLFATPKESIKVMDYVVTDNGITYVEKIRNGFKNSLVGRNNFGEKIKFNKSEVKAFRKNGREFKRLYLVEKGSYYVQSVILERLYTRAGYTIYKKTDVSYDDLTINDFYIYYKDKTLELQLNQENYKVVLSFFFTKFNKLYAK